MEIVKKKINIILLILFISLTFVFFYINNKETFSLGGESTRARLRKARKGLTKKGRKQLVENARARGTVLRGNKKSNTIGYTSNKNLSKKEVQSIARTLSSKKNITNMRSQVEKLERKLEKGAEKGNSRFRKAINKVSLTISGAQATSRADTGAKATRDFENIATRFEKKKQNRREARNKKQNNTRQKLKELQLEIVTREAEQASLEGTNTQNITRKRLRNALNLGEAARSGELAMEENTRQKYKKEAAEALRRSSAAEALLTDFVVESYKKKQNQFLTIAEGVATQRSKARNEISSTTKVGNRAVRGRDELISQEQKVKQEKETLEQEQEKLKNLKEELEDLILPIDLELAAKLPEYKKDLDNNERILKEKIIEQEATILEQKAIINGEREKLRGIADATKGEFVEYGKRREQQKQSMSKLNGELEQLKNKKRLMIEKRAKLEGLNLTKEQIEGILEEQDKTAAEFGRLMKQGNRVPQMSR